MNLLFINDIISFLRNLDYWTVRVPLSFGMFFLMLLLLLNVFRKKNDSKPVKYGSLLGAVILFIASALFVMA